MRRASIVVSLFLAVLALPVLGADWVELKIRGNSVRAELAATEPARARGLMERQELPADQGMLFVFGEEDYQSMWMVNTPLALSVAFIDGSGVIVSIAEMTPLSAQIHTSAAPSRYALEMNRGWFSSKGVKPGDRVQGLPPASRGR